MSLTPAFRFPAGGTGVPARPHRRRKIRLVRRVSVRLILLCCAMRLLGVAGFAQTDRPAVSPALQAPPNTVSGDLTVTGAVRARSVLGEVDPASFGLPSNGDPTRTTGSIARDGTALTVTSTASFQPTQGVFIGHAGAACGVRRGVPCPPGPTPLLSNQGAGGSTPYTYTASCIDELGGGNIAGHPATIAGPAALSADSAIRLRFTAGPSTAGCIQVLIQRNGALIGSQYIPATGTQDFLDYGQPPITASRDYPLAPPRAPFHDNLITVITSIAGTQLHVEDRASIAVSGAFVEHTDVPLIQRARTFVRNAGWIGSASNLRADYPLDFTNFGGRLSLTIGCDTGAGTPCVDGTGMYNVLLDKTSLNQFMANDAPSSVGILLGRNAAHPTSQAIDSDGLFIETRGGPVWGSHFGDICYYNYGAEIQTHGRSNFNCHTLGVLTASNLLGIQSPFDATQSTGNQSMSHVKFHNPQGGTFGPFWLIDNAFTLDFEDLYFNGGNSSLYPCGFYFFSQNGGVNVIGGRTEDRGGAACFAPGATLTKAKFDYELMHTPALNVYPALFMPPGTHFSQGFFHTGNYGGAGVLNDVAASQQALIGCGKQASGKPRTECGGFDNSTVITDYWLVPPADLCSAANTVYNVREGTLCFGGAFTWTSAKRISGADPAHLTDLNAIKSAGFYDGNNLGNTPPAIGTAFAKLTVHPSADPGSYGTQDIESMIDGTVNKWTRTLVGGAWYPWNRTAGGLNGKCPKDTVPSFENGLPTSCVAP